MFLRRFQSLCNALLVTVSIPVNCLSGLNEKKCESLSSSSQNRKKSIYRMSLISARIPSLWWWQQQWLLTTLITSHTTEQRGTVLFPFYLICLPLLLTIIVITISCNSRWFETLLLLYKRRSLTFMQLLNLKL